MASFAKLGGTVFLRGVLFLKGNLKVANVPKEQSYSGFRIPRFKNNANAAVSISGDFELNWAYRSLSEKERDFRGRQERGNIPLILKLLERYGIPITWATVGHLFLNGCKRSADQMPHADLPRPPQLPTECETDWYQLDPCSSLGKDPLWYGADLVKMILDSKVAHEIGSHSFSHIGFAADCSSTELVRREILECRRLMMPLGTKPSSLVFPRNQEGYSYLNVLSELGIIAVRHRDKRLRLSYPVRTTSGIYKIYESMNLRKSKYYDYPLKVRILVERAISRNAAFHIWFHPSDPPLLFEDEFCRILEYLSKERDKGTIWITTMGDLARYCEAMRRMTLHVKERRKQVLVSIHNSLDRGKYGNPDISIVLARKQRPLAAVGHNGKRRFEVRVVELEQGGSGWMVNLPAMTESLELSY